MSEGSVGVADCESEGEGEGDTLWESQFIKYVCKGNIRPLVYGLRGY